MQWLWSPLTRARCTEGEGMQCGLRVRTETARCAVAPESAHGQEGENGDVRHAISAGGPSREGACKGRLSDLRGACRGGDRLLTLLASLPFLGSPAPLLPPGQGPGREGRRRLAAGGCDVLAGGLRDERAVPRGCSAGKPVCQRNTCACPQANPTRVLACEAGVLPRGQAESETRRPLWRKKNGPFVWLCHARPAPDQVVPLRRRKVGCVFRTD
jgi:hypothetical protein